jgi:hypothetical protein
VSASFRYSDFDLYCTEGNVSIEPRFVSDHSAAPTRLYRARGQRDTRSNPLGNKEMSATLATIVRPARAPRDIGLMRPQIEATAYGCITLSDKGHRRAPTAEAAAWS